MGLPGAGGHYSSAAAERFGGMAALVRVCKITLRRDVANYVSTIQALICHLRYVDLESCLWQQRRQRERFESIAGHLGVAIDAGLALDHFTAAFHVGEKRVGLLGSDLGLFSPRDHRF